LGFENGFLKKCKQYPRVNHENQVAYSANYFYLVWTSWRISVGSVFSWQ